MTPGYHFPSLSKLHLYSHCLFENTIYFPLLDIIVNPLNPYKQSLTMYKLLVFSVGLFTKTCLSSMWMRIILSVALMNSSLCKILLSISCWCSL
jgi:hypothetical protein